MKLKHYYYKSKAMMRIITKIIPKTTMPNDIDLKTTMPNDIDLKATMPNDIDLKATMRIVAFKKWNKIK